MKTIAAVIVLLAASVAALADDPLDRVDQALTLGSADGALRLRASGLLDAEGYTFTQPAPAFLDSRGSALFTPRLSVFLDAQLGAHLYAFAQVRVDRGFDPATDRLRARLDEYALRYMADADGHLNLQAGKFATVLGSWVQRHASWDNPFVNAPLVYENLTGVWDAVPAPNLPTLLGWAHVRPRPNVPAPDDDKYRRLPVIWGPSYATGFSASGEFGVFRYATEVKANPLSSRPSTWAADVLDARYPTTSIRLGLVPNPAWQLGFSASSGVYLQPEAAAFLPPHQGRGDYRERVLGQDVSFAWHHLQIWAEAFEARFEIPRVGNADTFAYYIETRYKLTPQLYTGLRWNQQLFADMSAPDGVRDRWGANTSRIDAVCGYRFTAHVQLKLQLSLQRSSPAARRFGSLGATQLTVKF